MAEPRDEFLAQLRPLLKQYESRIVRKYEQKYLLLKDENERLKREVMDTRGDRENADPQLPLKSVQDFKQMNDKYINTLKAKNNEIELLKDTVMRLKTQLQQQGTGKNSAMVDKISVSQRSKQSQTSIFDFVKPSERQPADQHSINSPQQLVQSSQNQSQCSEDAEVYHDVGSSPIRAREQPLSPTQYSSEVDHPTSQLEMQRSQTTVAQLRDSFSIFPGNFAIDENEKTAESEEETNFFGLNDNRYENDFENDNRFDDLNDDIEYHYEEESPLSQKKRKFVIEDSQKDYEVLRNPKRVPLKDITSLQNVRNESNNRNNSNRLNFDQVRRDYLVSGSQITSQPQPVNLSKNFLENRDWINLDFKPNPDLLDSQEGLFTKKTGSSSGNCTCINCIKFHELAGNPLVLSREEKLNIYLAKINHGQQSHLFNFSIDAPGLNRSEFPTSQESRDDKIKLARINKIKALMRLIKSLELDPKTGKQVGAFLFRNEKYNEMVRDKQFIIDDWVYEELDLYVKDRINKLI